MPDPARPPDSTRSPFRSAGLIALLAAVYFAAAKMGLALAVVHPSATAVWPPTGIALAALLVLGARVWPGIAIGAFLANITTEGSLATAAGIALGNTLEAVIGAWLVQRFAGGRNAFSRPADVFRFLALAAGLSTVVSATVGVTTLSLWGYAPWSAYGSIWTTWWLGDGVGDLVVAPPLLLWAAGTRPRWPRRPVQAACAGALLVLTAVAFFGGVGIRNAPIAWFWLPATIWVSYSFGPRAAATTVLAVSTVTVLGTLRGLGPFVLPSSNASLLLLQAFLGVVSVSALTLSTVVSARERAMQDLGRARDELEDRVRERTAELLWANESLRSEMSERLRLEKELVEAGERERLRLGRDLHDDLGQLLTGIAFLASAVEKKLTNQSRPLARAVTEIRGLVQEAITKARRLSLGLTPVSLGTGGLLSAVQELAGMTERVFGVSCTLDYDERVVVDRPLAATNLYRIVQEAISNAVRHGGGRNIIISLACQDGFLSLTVRDDGVGLHRHHDRQGGLGLGIMKHRAEMLGGSLEVRSDGAGTTVTCMVPGIAHVEAAEPAPGPGPR